MPPLTEKVLTRNVGIPDAWEIEVYTRRGGYQALRKGVLEMKPEEISDAVMQSGLRGRGGAGFSTGMKWSFIPKGPDVLKYLCVNADESEPGTFSNRELLEHDPHQLIEGIILTCRALYIKQAFIYMRGEFFLGAERMQRAIDQAYAAGYLGTNILGAGFDLEIILFRGAGAYICGEETALLESLEGKRPMPRSRPPFPAAIGLYGKPTVINNVETLCNVVHIVERGVEWYTSIGNPPKNTGPKVYSISGLVQRPGNYEAALGTTMRELIFEYAGGMREGRTFKAVCPGGTSTPILTEAQLDIAMDYDTVTANGSFLGPAALHVMDDTVSIPHAIARMSRFYRHESCGKCTPCREGTPWIERIMTRIVTGQGRLEDLDQLLRICGGLGWTGSLRTLQSTTVCQLGLFAALPVESAIRHFRHEFEYVIQHGGACPPGTIDPRGRWLAGARHGATASVAAD
jgi:NADH-quinone oxidoreductase subunit F